MKKVERKIKNIMMLVTSMIIMIIGNVSYSEASSFSFNAQADRTEVTPGEEVIVEMSVSDIDMGEHGINVIEGFLEYDESFFSSMELVNENDWKITYNNEEGERKGKFLTAKMVEGVKTGETIGKIKLKVRDDITEGEGQVKIKTIQSNDGKSLVDEGERIITIKIKKEDAEPDVPQKNDENKNANTLQETTKEYEVKESENVKTGDNIIAVIGVMAIVIIANVVISIIRKKEKANNKIKTKNEK